MTRTIFGAIGIGVFAVILFIGLRIRQAAIEAELGTPVSQTNAAAPSAPAEAGPPPAAAGAEISNEPAPEVAPAAAAPAAAAASAASAYEAATAPRAEAVVGPTVTAGGNAAAPEAAAEAAPAPADPDALPGETAAAAPATTADTPPTPAAEPAEAAEAAVTPQAAEAVPALPAGPLPLPPGTENLPPRIVILGYNQFIPGSEWSDNDTHTPVELFERQMRLLQEKGFQVVALQEIVAALHGKGSLPRRAAAITLDNGFKQAAALAGAVLEKHHYPWTFFTFSNIAGAGGAGASWDDLRALSDKGVSIQSQTRSHDYLTLRKGRSDQEYSDWVVSELMVPKLMIERETGKSPDLLAFPYGNYNEDVQAKAQAAGYAGMLTVVPNPITNETRSDAIGRFMHTRHSSDLFEVFLDQPTLLLHNPQPSPGQIAPSGTQEISATLAYEGTFAPDSFEADIAGQPKPEVSFNPANGLLVIKPAADFQDRTIRVKFRAKDAATGQPVGAAWYFYNADAMAKADPEDVEGTPPAASAAAPAAAEPATPSSSPGRASSKARLRERRSIPSD